MKKMISMLFSFLIIIFVLQGYQLFSATITYDNVVIRSKPSSKSKKIGVLHKEEYVYIEKVGKKEKIGKWGVNHWYYFSSGVDDGRKEGWFYGAFVSTKISHDRVNLRSKPSLKSKVITKLKKGTKIIILKLIKVKDHPYAKWFYVKISLGKKGWVYSKYVDSLLFLK